MLKKLFEKSHTNTYYFSRWRDNQKGSSIYAVSASNLNVCMENVDM